MEPAVNLLCLNNCFLRRFEKKHVGGVTAKTGVKAKTRNFFDKVSLTRVWRVNKVSLTRVWRVNYLLNQTCTPVRFPRFDFDGSKCSKNLLTIIFYIKSLFFSVSCHSIFWCPIQKRYVAIRNKTLLQIHLPMTSGRKTFLGNPAAMIKYFQGGPISFTSAHARYCSL